MIDPTQPQAPYRIHRYPSALIDRVALVDGRVITIRPVLPQDADAERQLIARLSMRTRHRRFHVGVSALPDGVLQRLTEIDYRSHVALVAEAPGADDDPIVVADARYVRDRDAAAEFAIVVDDAWQGVGLGRELLRRLARHARRNGLLHLHGEVQSDNAPMRALARRVGASVTPIAGDATALRISLDLTTEGSR